jgi:hypothetical protein
VAFFAACAGAIASLVAGQAAANGRFPAANQLFFSPSDANLVVLRTTFGILISHDGGTSWVWLCEDALGLSPVSSEDPTLGITGGGSLVAGVSWALQVSPDLGCSWNVMGGALKNKDFVDVAVRPDAPHSIVALQSSYSLDAGVGGGRGYVTQVFESTDDGANWSPVGSPIDPSVVGTTIDVAASDLHRIYVSGHRFAAEAGAPISASLFEWTDVTMSWAERPLPALDPAKESAVFIGAVDPTNADIVYLRSGQGAQSPQPSRLFVTSNAGQSFQVPLTLAGQMAGFALSPDGKTLYVGGVNDGLLVATTANLAAPNAFTTVAPSTSLHVECLAAHGTDLWACSDEVSGFIAGVSTNAGTSFTPKLHLVNIQTPIQCGADAAAAQCSGGPFEMLCRMFSNCPTGDGGPPVGPDGGSGSSSGSGGGSGGSGGSGSGSGSGSSGGGGSGGSSSSGGASGNSSSGGGSGSPPPTGSSSGCSVFGGGGAIAGLAMAAAGVLAIIARRRRSTR